MLIGWGSKAGWLIPFVNERVGGRQNARYLVNMCHSERFRGECAHKGAILMSCLQFLLLQLTLLRYQKINHVFLTTVSFSSSALTRFSSADLRAQSTSLQPAT